jgi:hypothetical protein
MKNIKSFEYFTKNEELNWKDIKKTAAGVALGAGLAFGSPDKAKGQDIDNKQATTATHKQDPESVEYSEVINAPGKSLSKILDDVLNRLSDLRKDKSVVNSFNYERSGPGRLSGKMQLNVTPKNAKGFTEAEFEIIMKEGKYKIIIKNINFIHVGQQPMTAGETMSARYRPMVGTAASQAIRRAGSGKLGGFGDVLSGVAASAVQNYALKQKKSKENFNLKSVKTDSTEVGEKPKNMKQKEYNKYSEDIKKSADYFISLFSKPESKDDF